MGTNGGSELPTVAKSIDSKNFIFCVSTAVGLSLGSIVNNFSTVSIASLESASSSTGHSISVKYYVMLLNIFWRMYKKITSANDVIEHFLLSFVVEWRNSRHKLVQATSESPPIYRKAVTKS